MTLYPVYRMTVFAPDSETTVLTPAASAPHSSEFKVATKQGIAGFEPFMEFPSGRKSKFNPIDGKYTISSTAVVLSDQKTDVDGSDLQRFITGFIGDEQGKARLIGLKVAIEESVDDGVTFNVQYIGQIESFDLMSPLRFKITLKDGAQLQRNIVLFEGEASASLLDHANGGYSNKRVCSPIGPDIGYGNVGSLNNIRAKWRFGRADTNRAIDVKEGSDYNNENGRMWVCKPLLDAVENGGTDAWKITTQGRRQSQVVARVTQGGTVGRFVVTYLKRFNNGGISSFNNQPLSIHSITVEELSNTSAFEYQPLSAFADDSNITFQLLFVDSPSEDFPLLLNYVKPAQLLKDIMLGKFSQLDPSTGAARYSGSIPIDVAAFQTLIDDGSYRDSRWYIKKPEKLNKWVQENILKAYQIGYRIEPQLNGGRFENVYVPFDMRLPKDLSGINTITEADLDAEQEPTWSPGKPFVNIETKYYVEAKTTKDSLRVGGEGVNVMEGPINPTLVTESERTFKTVNLANIQAKGGNYNVDSRGVRFFPFEKYADAEWEPIEILFFTIKWPRSIVMRRMIEELHDRAQFRWSRGPATVTFQASRVAATNDLKIGEYVILDVDVLPSEFTHTRGESRLVQIIERSEVTTGPYIKFSAIDSGINLQRSAPTVGAFQQIGVTNTASGTISVLQPGTVHTSFAITDQSTLTAPDETSSLWILADIRDFTVSSSQQIITGEFPNGSRVWHRAFIQPDATQDFELPSDFGFEGGDGFVDIVGILTPPSNLEIFNISPSGASATWDVGETTASVQIRMKQDNESNFSDFAILSPGTDRLTFYDRSTLPAANPQTIGVRHFEKSTGTVSVEVSGTFDITDIPIQEDAPGPARLFIVDQPESEYDTSVEGGDGLFSSLFTVFSGGFNPPEGSTYIATVKLRLYMPFGSRDFNYELQRRTGLTGDWETIRLIRGTNFSWTRSKYEMTDADEILTTAGAFFYRGRIVRGGYNPTPWTDPPKFARPAIFFTQTEFDDLAFGSGEGFNEEEYGELEWRTYTGGDSGEFGDFE